MLEIQYGCNQKSFTITKSILHCEGIFVIHGYALFAQT